MLIGVEEDNNFDHWEINNHTVEDITLSSISLSLTQDDTIRAVFNDQNTSDILVINEFMADNETTIADELDEYEDWIELYYNIPYTMSLNGYFLTDDLNNPSKWTFPDIEISGEGYILIWADDDEEQGPMHTNFKLSNDGEQIGFFDPNLNLLDQITFSQQSDDVSYGRVTDGSYSWQFFNQSTPSYSNTGEEPCMLGDLNCDEEVNVVDVVLVLNLIMADDYQSNADINSDYTIDILDIVQLVNMILN